MFYFPAPFSFFRAITCEGCKGFFRRAFQRRMHFECKGQGKCPMGKDTRNGCQQCRLDKCMAQGMDPQLVLNEPQRVAKKSLIERNRVHKQLERVQLRVRKALAIKEPPAQLRSLISRSAREYCAQMDRPLEQDMDMEQFGTASPEAQFAMFWGQMLARLVAFGNSFAEFAALDQASMLPQLGWLPAVLFHGLQPSKEDSNPLLLPDSSNSHGEVAGEESGLEDSFGDSGSHWFGDSGSDESPLSPRALGLAPDLAVHLARLSRSLLSLQLSHAQLGLSVAFLLFHNIQTPEFHSLCDTLLKALRVACLDNMALGDSEDERLAQWPVLLGRLAQLEVFAHRHRDQLMTKQSAKELAKLFT